MVMSCNVQSVVRREVSDMNEYSVTAVDVVVWIRGHQRSPLRLQLHLGFGHNREDQNSQAIARHRVQQTAT
jgi:hypothetical protein